MPRHLLLAVAAAGAVVAAAGGAMSQQAPGTPPPWDTLVRCAETASEDARLACYDAAMRAAGYAPKPAEVAAEKRKRFGLSIPKVGALKSHGKEEGAKAGGARTPPPKENENEITVELAQVATVQPATGW